jgi:hypothetical protein
MCEHLSPLEEELKSKNIKETYRGQPWTRNCREWVYFDCYLDMDKIRARYQFPDFIISHRNDDGKSGLEAGFYCDQCKDAIIGAHPEYKKGKIKFE